MDGITRITTKAIIIDIIMAAITTDIDTEEVTISTGPGFPALLDIIVTGKKVPAR